MAYPTLFIHIKAICSGVGVRIYFIRRFIYDKFIEIAWEHSLRTSYFIPPI